MSFEIVQIVPYLPPAVSGVGDHAALLARVLRDRHGITTRFIVTAPDANSSQSNGCGREYLTSREAGQLTARLNTAATVILHYAGYGYQQRGCPRWLVRGLTDWRRGAAARRLITMFHELYAFGPIWRSSFWTSPLQRQLTRTLARLSDHCVTNQSASQTWLAKVGQRVSVLPVFSTVGESQPNAKPAMQREPTMIVFGSAPWRRQAYHEHRQSLESACAALGIQRIIDIGAPCGAIGNLPVPACETGIIPAAKVSQHLAQARAGFFTYPAPYLGKSSIFAAYTAHAVVPVTYAGNTSVNQDGLRAGEHFLVAGKTLATADRDFVAIGGAANAWYRSHNVNRQASHYAELLSAAAQSS